MNADETTARLLTEAWQHFYRGNLAHAEELSRQVLARDANQPEALNLQGSVAQKRGQLDVAIARLRQAVASDPANAQYWNNLGTYFTYAGRLNEALGAYQRALQLRPDFADTYSNLSYVLCQLGRCEEARLKAEKALQLRPGFAEAHNHFGLVLMDLGRPSEAAEHFQQAIQHQPHFAGACRNLGVALQEQGRLSEAVVRFKEALALKPDFGAVYNDLGDVLKQQGRLEEAVSHYCEAKRLRPNDALIYYNLSHFASEGHYRMSKEEIAHLHALVQSDRVSLQDKSIAHMALGNVFDRQGDYDTAFVHFREGNELRKQLQEQAGRGFDPAAHRALIDKLIRTFDESFFLKWRPAGSGSELPVFVVGMPRSGTTLVEQILSSHSQVAGAGEMRELGQLVNGLGKKMDPVAKYPECISRLEPSELRELATHYLECLSRLSGSAVRVIDKMPENFLYLGVIAVALPKARVIHCCRDPLDVCLSCYFQIFRKVNYSRSLDHLGMYYKEYERLMKHWQPLLPQRMMEVRYEHLVGRQETVSRELVAFCGLDWEDSCLKFHDNPRPVRTSSSVQVRRPMYVSSLGRWRKYASHLEPLRQALGLAGPQS
jgi:tetratricopeptide (TPR) repeat protein